MAWYTIAMEQDFFVLKWLFNLYKRRLKAVLVKQLKREAWANYRNNKCAICDNPMTRKERTMDHIIPESICWELEMPGLVYDGRNIRYVHALCNQRRSSDISDLPLSVQLKLHELRQSKSLVETV